MSNATPRVVENKIIIKEVARSHWWTRITVGLLGMAAIFLIASYGLVDMFAEQPFLLLLVIVAVISFGLGALLASRHRGDFEMIEVNQGRVRLLVSQVSAPLFDATIAHTRLQRIKHPMGLRICLRDENRAIEIGNQLSVPDREILANHIDTVLAKSQPEH